LSCRALFGEASAVKFWGFLLESSESLIEI